MVLNEVIELVNNSPDYTWIASVVTGIATIIVTMLTIYYTNKTTRTQITSEIENYQKTQLIDFNKEVLEDAARVIRLNDLKKTEQEKLIRKLIVNVMAHGSKESISILADFQQFNYKPDSQKPGKEKYKAIVYPTLLISQIKFETTGVIINPIDILKILLKLYMSF